MKDLETIKQIINEDEVRPYLKQPFSDGIHTYAANPWVSMRIKGEHCDLIPSDFKIPLKGPLEIFDTFKFSKERCTLTLKSHEVKEIIEELRDNCPECKGEGKVYEQVCYECDGDGEVTVGNDHSSYECTCNTCHGKMILKTSTPMICRRCNGSGKDIIKGVIKISENSFISIRLIEYVFDIFDEIKIAVDSESIKHGIPFINGEIEGIIMPCDPGRVALDIKFFDYTTKSIIEPGL